MDLAPDTFQELAAVIRRESGMLLGPDKSYLVRHRLEPVLRAEKLDSFETLVNRLHMRTGSALCNAVINAITVQETRFFRDQSCFDGLREHVLPECTEMIRNPQRVGARQRLRIWSAAAATGQEAYSLSMLIREFAASGPGALNENHVTIVASDISPTAIESAKAARYTPAEVHRGLSEARLKEHCHLRGEHWHISEPVRRLVQFRTFNLLHSTATLGAFDVILCRNVLIYFDDPTRRKIIQGLYAALHPGGWLILGSAESLYGMEERFETLIHARAIFYRKPCR
jgi:chemotaxis protein methyltransferase CheR